MSSARGISRVGAVGAALALTAGVLAWQPADAVKVRQTFTVPATGTFAFAGHGFGHGRGMSQYGAQSAALQGRSAAAILAFYYPGTRRTTTKATMRVLISSDTTRDVQVLAQSGLTVTDLGSRRTYRLPDLPGVNRWRLNVSRGKAVIGYRTRGWHRYRLPGGLANLVGDGQFRAPSGRLTLVTPTGRLVLRGALRAASLGPGSSAADRDTVNVLSINNYVKGVVPREMPTSWKPAAVRAQAIAARTYALFERAADRSRPYDICDTSACQVYGGVAAEDAAGNAAVKATAGMYLTWKGAPAFTQFSASSGGWTVAGGFPYLPSQADPYDDWAGNHYHDWRITADPQVLSQRYPRLGRLTAIKITQRTGGGQWGGQVLTAKLVGTTSTITVSGTDLRSAYGMPSAWFMPVK